MMSSLEDFVSLPLDEQIMLLFEHGTCIMSIRYYGYKVNLYLYGSEYVEVFYNHKQDLIEKILPLDYTTSRIDFYAAQIKLPRVLA